MYDYQGLNDPIFLVLYWGVAVLAAVAGLAMLAVYVVYTSNAGELPREYLSQVISVVLVAWVVWRTESLQELSDGGPCEGDVPSVCGNEEGSEGDGGPNVLKSEKS